MEVERDFLSEGASEGFITLAIDWPTVLSKEQEAVKIPARGARRQTVGSLMYGEWERSVGKTPSCT